MQTSAPAIDPVAVLSRLSPDQIESRIEQLRAEDAALRVLLRAIRARDRRKPKRVTPQQCEVAHA
jgi:hypothetical protein